MKTMSLPGVLLIAAMLARPDERAPAPDASEQAKIQKTIRDVFKAEYQKRAPGDRLILAAKLEDQGRQSRDDLPSQYVLWTEARDLYLEGGDLESALGVITQIQRRFVADTVAMKSAAISSAQKTAKSPEETARLVRTLLKTVDEAVELEDGEGAQKTAELAITMAKRAKDLSLVSRAQARAKEVAEQKRKLDQLKRARETLAQNPDDREANSLVGRFECMTKGRWEAGLPLLARGSDAATSMLASTDLAAPGLPSDQMALADGWWSLGETEAGPGRLHLRERAALWYEKCLPGLSGLAKSKSDQRLRAFRIESVSQGEWVDATDPSLFGLKGKAGDPIELVARVGAGADASLRSFPKGEFDGLMVRAHVPRGVCGIIEFERAQFGIWIDGRLQEVHVSRTPGDHRWIPYVAAKVGALEDFLVTVILSEGSYVVCFDGKEIYRLPTKATQITFLGLYTGEGTSGYDQIRLRRRS